MKIKFRDHLKSDIPYRVKWLNDKKVNKYIGNHLGRRTNTKEQADWFFNYEFNHAKKFFTICDNTKPIGFMGFTEIDRYNKNGAIFIAIGEIDYQGCGIGTLAMEYLINYGFKRLKLHKLTLAVLEKNLPAIKLYKKLGFKVEGKTMEDVKCGNKFFNTILMGLIKK